jgi:hypothetical protein
VQPDVEQGDRVAVPGRVHDRGPFAVGDRGDSGAEYLEGVAIDQDRGVLVDAHAEVIRVERDCAQQPREPATLREMHVDEQPGRQPEPRPGAHGGRRDFRALAAEDHRPAHSGRTGAGARDDQAAAELLAEDVVGARADQGQDPGLIATAEEHPGGIAQRGGGGVGVGVRPAPQPELPGLLDAELTEDLLVLGVYLIGPAGRGGDQSDPGLAAPAQFHEPFQDAGTAAPVLAPADDQQAARWHTILRVLIHGCVVTQRHTF